MSCLVLLCLDGAAVALSPVTSRIAGGRTVLRPDLLAVADDQSPMACVMPRP